MPSGSVAGLGSEPAGPARAPRSFYPPSRRHVGFLRESRGAVWGGDAGSSEGRSGCIVCGAQRHMKMQGPCSKERNSAVTEL